GDNISITGAEGSVGVYAMYNGQVDLTGDLDIGMSSPMQLAIATQHNNGYAASRIKAAGRMNINGSIYARGGTIDLDMSPDSSWTGSAFSDNLNSGHLNVLLNDSTWRVVDNSNVDTLSLNKATVDLADAAFNPDEFTTLNVADLKGNGTFVMRTDIQKQEGDLLRVTNTSAGNHQLTVRNQGS